MGHVTLTAMNGRTLSLEYISSRDTEDIWTYQATLEVPGGAISTVVHDYSRGLAWYFQELADAWSGFKGAKSFASLEGQLTIDAHHDGLGTVRCLIGLQQPWPPEWTFNAMFDFGAGAQLSRIANNVHRFVG